MGIIGSTVRFALLRATAFGLAVALLPSAAWGLDAKKEAAAEYVAGQEAARAGRHRSALEHALQAWQLDGSNPLYLLQVADQAALADELDRAEQAYRQWLELPGRDLRDEPAVRAKLVTVGNRKLAGKKADEAVVAAAANDHAAASRLYQEALRLDPAHADFARAAGMQALQAGDEARGIELLQDYLQQTPASADGRPQAEQLLRERGAPLSRQAAGQVPQSSDAFTHKGAGFWALVGGGVLVAGGLAALAASDAAASDLAALKAHGALGDVQDQASARQATYCNLGIGLGITGVVVAGAGAWLRWFGPAGNSAPVWVVPVQQGVGVAGSF